MFRTKTYLMIFLTAFVSIFITKVEATDSLIIHVDNELCDPNVESKTYFRLGNWTNDSNTLYFMTDDTIWQYTIGSKQKIPHIKMCDGSNLSMDLSRDEKLMAIGSQYFPYVTLVDLQNSIIIGYLPIRADGVWGVRFNHDGSLIAFSTYIRDDGYPLQANLQIWSVEEQVLLGTLLYQDIAEGTKYITEFDFQPLNEDCPFILAGAEVDAGYYNSFVECWDWENGDGMLYAFPRLPVYADPLFTDDYIILSTLNREYKRLIQFLDKTSFDLVHEQPIEASAEKITYSESQSLLGMGLEDYRIQIYSLIDDTITTVVTLPETTYRYYINFSPDGSYLAVAFRESRDVLYQQLDIYDTQTLEKVDSILIPFN